MTDDHDPPRLRSGREALSPELERVLSSLDDALPTPAEMAGLDARLRSLIDPTSTRPPPAPPAPPGAIIAKPIPWIVGALVVAGVIGAFFAALDRGAPGDRPARAVDERPTGEAHRPAAPEAVRPSPMPARVAPGTPGPRVDSTPPTTPRAPVRATRAARASAPDVASDGPAPTAEEATTAEPPTPPPPPLPTTPDPSAATSEERARTTAVEIDAREARILWSARRALRGGDAVSALELARQHERDFGAGVLAQEREAIAIEAMAALGRRGEARARFDRFRASYPQSTYRAALERALAE